MAKFKIYVHVHQSENIGQKKHDENSELYQNKSNLVFAGHKKLGSAVSCL